MIEFDYNRSREMNSGEVLDLYNAVYQYQMLHVRYPVPISGNMCKLPRMVICGTRSIQCRSMHSADLRTYVISTLNVARGLHQ